MHGWAGMRVLITWGSRLGGTEGIGRMLGDALGAEGFDVVLRPAREVHDLDGIDAVVLGGALYANRWHADARGLVERHLAELRRVPVWMFSSGPLDDSAEVKELPPPRMVRALMERVGALGHRTFGGRLEKGARDWMASQMAKTLSGDWRNPARIRAWGVELARALPDARPGQVVASPGGSIPRMIAYGLAGWALHAATALGLPAVFGAGAAAWLHALAAPLIFVAVAAAYFAPRGAQAPAVTAHAWTIGVAALDLGVVGAAARGDLELATSLGGFWLPLVLICAATRVTGAVREMLPFPTPSKPPRPGAPTAAAPRPA